MTKTRMREGVAVVVSVCFVLVEWLVSLPTSETEASPVPSRTEWVVVTVVEYPERTRAVASVAFRGQL
jgi:hypothetical protein